MVCGHLSCEQGKSRPFAFEVAQIKTAQCECATTPPRLPPRRAVLRCVPFCRYLNTGGRGSNHAVIANGYCAPSVLLARKRDEGLNGRRKYYAVVEHGVEVHCCAQAHPREVARNTGDRWNIWRRCISRRVGGVDAFLIVMSAVRSSRWPSTISYGRSAPSDGGNTTMPPPRMPMGLDASGPDLSAFAVVPIVQMPPIAASAHNKPRSSVRALRIGCQSVRFGTACVNVDTGEPIARFRHAAQTNGVAELHGQLL
jgi:hypothetical protein